MTRTPTKAFINIHLLKWGRENVPLSIEAAAEKIGVNKSLIKSWEKGTNSPTFEQLLFISEIYGLPVSMFYLSEIPDPPLLERDNEAREAVDYLNSMGFTADDYRDEIEKDDIF